MTSKASPCEIIMSRPTAPCDCRVVLPVCYRQIVQLGDTSSNYQLQPGDRIVVGSRSLIEELSFCKQRQGCDLCCRSLCAARDPNVANYRNRILRLPFAPPLPRFLEPSKNKMSSQDGNDESSGKKKSDSSLEKEPLADDPSVGGKENGLNDK